MNDLRYAARTLRANVGFTTATVLTLALAIGASTAVFSAVDAVLLEPLPYPNAGRLAVLSESSPAHHAERVVVSPANYLDWRARTHVFQQLAAVFDWQLALTGVGDPEEISVQAATASLFPLLGIQPLLGRGFTSTEDAPGGENVVVLSTAFWQRRFSRDPRILGRAITLGGKPYTVIGVMPADFALPGSPADAWVPLRLDPAQPYRQITGRFLTVLGRLAPGITLDRAQSEMRAVAHGLALEYPQFNGGWTVSVVSLYEQVVGNVRRALLVVAGVVAFVLLIACANVANLLLTRAVARQHDVAVRTALGASTGQVLRQLLTESLVLAGLGAVLGLLLARVLSAVLAAKAAVLLPRIGTMGLNLRVLAFTIVLALLIGLVFGAIAARHTLRVHLLDVMTGGNRSVTGGGRSRSVLLVAQVALSLVLLAGAGLMIQSMARIERTSPGFDPAHVLTAKITLPLSRYRTGDRQVRFFRDVLARARVLPGVQAAGAIDWLPFTGLAAATGYAIEGAPPPRPGEEPTADVRVVSADYFKALRISRLAGEVFTGEERPDGRTVVVVNASLARAIASTGNPIGKSLTMKLGTPVTGEIIGVVGDVRHAGLDSLAKPTVYWTLPQLPSSFMTLAIRTSGEPNALATAVRRLVWSVDPDQPVGAIKALESYIGDSIARRRFVMTTLTGFAALALILAGIGIYGVVSYTVALRTREIGVRMAIGAPPTAVLRSVLGHGVLAVAVGVVLGVAGALALTRVLGSLLYGVSPTDGWTILAMALVLLSVVVVAMVVPAHRATHIDPVIALRME